MILKSKFDRLVNGLLKRSYWYNHVAFEDCRKFWSLKDFKIDVINLGSTSGLNAFNYSQIKGIKAYNWAMSRQPLLCDFEILRNYYSFLRPGATVILSLCPFSSLVGYDCDFEDKFYTILHSSSIPHFSFKRKARIMAIKDSPVRYFPLFGFFSECKKILLGLEKKMRQSAFADDANRWINNWKFEFSISDLNLPLSLKNKDSQEDIARILHDIVLFCEERNFRVALVIPPISSHLGSHFTPAIREMLIDSVIQKANIQNVPFLNYMGHPQFANNVSLFRNSFLLNEKGAKLFTLKVLEDLELV